MCWVGFREEQRGGIGGAGLQRFLLKTNVRSDWADPKSAFDLSQKAEMQQSLNLELGVYMSSASWYVETQMPAQPHLALRQSWISKQCKQEGCHQECVIQLKSLSCQAPLNGDGQQVSTCGETVQLGSHYLHFFPPFSLDFTCSILLLCSQSSHLLSLA